ncbi:MAG: N-acetyltransferase family protein [Flavisolibacter sp.]
MTEVRLAKKEDASQILQIYSPSILTSATSFETVVPSVADMQSRIQTCLEKYPWIVCDVDGNIAAYVYASKHREREAYQWTCESSVYVHNQFKGKGIGVQLYGALFRVLKLQGFTNVYAGITLPNQASVRLHEKCGFIHFATYEDIGYKLGNWHTVGWWKLRINNYDPDPPPPLKLSQLTAESLSGLFKETARGINSRLTG